MATTAPVVKVAPRTLSRDFRRVFRNLERCGDVVWVDTGRQRFLLVNTADLVREMLVERGSELVKPDSQTVETGPPSRAPADDGIPVPEFRAALARGMGAGRVPDVLSAVAEASEREQDGWRDGMRLELMRMLRRLSVEVVCRASFGSSLAPEEVDRAEHALHRLERNLQVNTATTERLDRLKGHRSRRRRAFDELDDLGRSLLANADLSRPTELTATVEDLPRLVTGLTDAHGRAVLTELFVGAADPMTQTAAWSMARFAENTARAAALRAEWRDALTTGSPLDRETLSRLPLTEAFVREVTRLHPTNERITRQAVVDTSLGGEPVPALTRVILNVDALHRDPRVYDDPERFAPERWLGGRPARHKFGYVAFGLGGRRCLGETIAMTAVTAMLPAFGRAWDFDVGRLRLSRGSRRQPAERTRVGLRAAVRP